MDVNLEWAALKKAVPLMRPNLLYTNADTLFVRRISVRSSEEELMTSRIICSLEIVTISYV